MRFEFATATRILFGAGVLREIGPLARELGSVALVVTGRSPQRAEFLIHRLLEAGVKAVVHPISGEPTVEAVCAGIQQAKTEACNLIIGYGGGSAIDGAKAIAALMTNAGDILDYLEVIGRGQTLHEPPAPFIAIPTTAGTGAEVTRNAVLTATAQQVKVSLRSPLMLPKLAVVDPETTYDLPPAITAATGFDALAQLIEPYLSLKANPMTDGFCLEGMARVAASLHRVCEHGHSPQAREDMALASLFGGLALANAGLGAVHGFASPIGGMYPAPHGTVCASLLPQVMAINLRALRQRAPGSEALRRFETIGRVLSQNPHAKAEDGIEWVRQLCRILQIPPLRTFGISAQNFPRIIALAAKASSMKGNPLPLTQDELMEILQLAL